MSRTDCYPIPMIHSEIAMPPDTNSTYAAIFFFGEHIAWFKEEYKCHEAEDLICVTIQFYGLGGVWHANPVENPKGEILPNQLKINNVSYFCCDKEDAWREHDKLFDKKDKYRARKLRNTKLSLVCSAHELKIYNSEITHWLPLDMSGIAGFCSPSGEWIKKYQE